MADRMTATAKQLTSSGVVTTAGVKGLLCGYSIKVGTATSAVIQFLDGGSGGTVRWEDGWDAVTAAGDVYIRHSFPVPIAFGTDIYCTLAGTGTVVSVSYIEG